MTPPIFHLDDEVEIIGVRCDGQAELAGKRFKISQYHVDQDGERCSAIGFPWYPASSLHLVEEELKMGDWVKRDDLVFQISDVHTGSREILCLNEANQTWYSSTTLRKLTPDETAMHTSKANTFTVKIKCDTSELEAWLDKAMDKVRALSTGTIGYEMQEFQAATAKGMAALGKLLAPIVEKHVEDAIKRLSDIEKQLAEQNKSYQEDGRFQAKINCDIKERLCILEGEMPEVAYRLQTEIPVGARFSVEKMLNGSVSLTYSDCGIELAKRVLDSVREA